MQDTVLFLGGHLTGLRKPYDRRWRHACDFRDPVIFIVPDRDRARASISEEMPLLAPALKTERYVWYDFGALDVSLMVLEGLVARDALSQYLRGEPVL